MSRPVGKREINRRGVAERIKRVQDPIACPRCGARVGHDCFDLSHTFTRTIPDKARPPREQGLVIYRLELDKCARFARLP
jgi:hypothetical protein